MFEEIILLAISVSFLTIGIYLWKQGSQLLTTGKKAKAIVFKNNYSPGTGTNRGVYFPVVRFLTDKQEWITQELNIGSNPALEEGSQLEIIYDPDDPTNVAINSTFQLEILPRIFVTIGLCGLIFGALELFDITQFIAH